MSWTWIAVTVATMAGTYRAALIITGQTARARRRTWRPLP